MGSITGSYNLVIEAGKKKVFAIAVHWPGWCRFGRDEPSALQILVDAAHRYSKIAKYANLDFIAPESIPAINVIAHLQGNTTTDFGAPDAEFPNDWDPVREDELDRYMKLLKACWAAFDMAVKESEGRTLRKGPRGGGRDLEKIMEHVLLAELGYLRALGWKPDLVDGETMAERTEQVRREVIRGLQVAVDGGLPRKGPRGGKRWSPRFFVRRLAWHAVDHAWEIEDRMV